MKNKTLLASCIIGICMIISSVILSFGLIYFGNNGLPIYHKGSINHDFDYDASLEIEHSNSLDIDHSGFISVDHFFNNSITSP